MSMKKDLAMLTIMAAMMSDSTTFGRRIIDETSTPREVIKPIPNGCQRFYYNKQGLCPKSESEIFFDAMKPSSARKKYEKWISQLNIK